MSTKSQIPVYINYGKKNFFKTYNLFKEFLKTVPYEKLEFKDSVNRSAGIIVSPRNNSGIPWCNITIALLYAHKKMPFKIILDDLNFLDPEWEYQLNAVEETVEYICNNLNTSYLNTSVQVDTDLDDFDYKEINRLSIINGIWNVRNLVPSENLNQYINLSYAALETNAKKIKGLYSTNIFEHCVHQSLVNNNGGLHKWFGKKYGVRVGCMDISQGRGLVGIKDVPGYNSDLPDTVKKNMTDFLDSTENKQIAINEAIKEHKLRKNGQDARTYQIVSTCKSDTPVEVDILIPINILWDAASLGKNQFFESPLFWLQETINFILTKTTARVVVRQHPAEREFEIYGTGKKLGEYLQNQFGNHPCFRFISCNDNINTYLLLEQCKVVLPHTSTVGIEAALMGKKVIIESSVYYKDQPFVVKAESKEDYFNKIKQFYEEYDQFHNNIKDNIGYENALLLYFLLTQCSIVESNFGLDPLDFENWTPRGFDLLTRDENLMTAIEALISGKPFPYLNGMKKLKHLKDRLQRVTDWPKEQHNEIIQRINSLITLINNQNYEEALEMMPDSSEHDGAYLYPRAFALSRLNRFEEAQQTLKKLNALKPIHQYSRFLAGEIRNESRNI